MRYCRSVVKGEPRNAVSLRERGVEWALFRAQWTYVHCTRAPVVRCTCIHRSHVCKRKETLSPNPTSTTRLLPRAAALPWQILKNRKVLKFKGQFLMYPMHKDTMVKIKDAEKWRDMEFLEAEKVADEDSSSSSASCSESS